jgi:hypothetical protein
MNQQGLSVVGLTIYFGLHSNNGLKNKFIAELVNLQICWNFFARLLDFLAIS